MNRRGDGEETGRLAGRARLAERLRAGGLAGAEVSGAFLAVPRHVFLSGESAERAYEDTAIVIKSDADGLPVSASTQPAMMAIMLEQLGLAPGHRVLEVGTGSGYNAALIAQIVGESGSVVTIDIHPELVDRARASLAAAGFARVTVTCGDGTAGVPGRAPYDRIIVTAGVWDLAPQWLAQLAAGRLAGQAVVWDALGRPGAGTMELAAYPAGSQPKALDGRLVIRRPNTVMEAGWPSTA